MNMDDPIFRQKYKKYKLRVKFWEKEFKKKNGRVPSKYDIREAPQDIRDSYKMYYKLKTSFLEDTLNDVLSDDGFDVLEMSNLSQNDDGDINGSLNESVQYSVPGLPLDISGLIENEVVQTKLAGLNDKSEIPRCSVGMALVNENRPTTSFEPEVELDINKRAWGMSKKVKEEKKEATNRILKTSFNEKLFHNVAFGKRNPRKSLSRTTLDSSIKCTQINLNGTQSAAKETLPDLETILLQKAKEQQGSTTLVAKSDMVAEKSREVKTNIDEGWLCRNAGHDYTLSDNQAKNGPDRKILYGLSNIDLSKLKGTGSEELQSEVMATTNPNRSGLNTSEEFYNQKANLKVLVREVGLKAKQSVSDSVVGNSEDGLKAKQSDSDSVVGNSEDEEENRHITKRRKVLKSTSYEPEEDKKIVNSSHNVRKNRKQYPGETSVVDAIKSVGNTDKKDGKRKQNVEKKNLIKSKKPEQEAASRTRSSKKKTAERPTEDDIEEMPLNPEDIKFSLALERSDITSVPRIKLTELEQVDNLAKEYINKLLPMSDSGPTTTKLMTPAEEKRAGEKRKLEAKIASGKLNENYVTINIQKKTFVRGKKSINYSKYKKKLWKDKKQAAALSGPNMDMRGCDGGTLKCFTCGQTGHFAQNCKIKGDSLLPLSAQVDDSSPFPTLEEAKQMACQSALSVHSRNIEKLPPATNSAIYRTDHYGASDKQVENDTACVHSDTVDPDSNATPTISHDLLMDSDEDLETFNVDDAVEENKIADTPLEIFKGHKIPESFLKAAGLDNNDKTSNSAPSKFSGVEPLFDVNKDGSVKEVTAEVVEVLKMFGHTNFRKGQDRAVMRILSGMSTLVTLSTGSGKSLCYQLPAYMYSRQCKAITLVISPLVSLMEDQVTGVPHFLRAHCLHTNQTPQQRMKTMQIIADGEIDVLLVSPEAVVSGERSTGFGSILRQLPPIAFACIDEAHCVSQWSHNFRPSYLMICKVLRKNLGVKCVLGLTATATLPTRLSIINHLGITDGENGVISDIPLPDNLILSVSKDDNKDASLLQLLLSKRFENCQSIIIYCTRRDECERVAGFLRTCLQDRKTVEPENAKKKRKRVNWHAEPYHAGMNASRRRTIQNAFMNNELRIVVATIAFGMGINKPDIRAVIHYNMPSNYESYVQEVGRAGRDSKISHCHLFLDANGGDKSELKRHIYANSLDRHVIRKLLQKIFVPCSCDKNINNGVLINPAKAPYVSACNKIKDDKENSSSVARDHVCPGHEIGFSMEKAVEALDIPAENISTLLCYMELDNRWNISVLSNAYIMAKVISYGGTKYLKHAANECPPLAMAIAVGIKNGSFKETENVIEFSVIDIASAIGWNSGVVKYQLKNLEWVNVNGYQKRSPITVSFHDLGFRIKAPGDFTIEEIDEALDSLYQRSCEQEKKQLIQLQYVFQGLSSVAYRSHVPCCSETFSHDRCDQLKAIIRDYFRNDYPKNMELEIEQSNVSDADIEDDVLTLISLYPENNFTGRNVARLFHGISSPNYPAVMWHRCKFWRTHSKTDFNRIVKLANNVIVRRRT